jgi:hypothetical protein
MHDSECQTKVNEVFRRLIKRRSEAQKRRRLIELLVGEWLRIHSTKNEMPRSWAIWAEKGQLGVPRYLEDCCTEAP